MSTHSTAGLVHPALVAPRHDGVFTSERIQKVLQIRALLKSVWRGKWIVAACVTAALAIQGYRVVNQQPEYQAGTTVYIDLARRAPSAEYYYYGGQRDLDNELWLVTHSQDVAERTAGRLLATRMDASTGQPLAVVHGPGGEMLQPTVAAAKILQHVGVVRIGAVDAVRVTARSFSPSEAALIANVFAEEYIEYTRQMSRAGMNASRTYLQEQEARMRLELNSIESRIAAFQVAQRVTVPNDAVANTLNQITQLETLRDAARIDLETERASLRRLEQELAQIEPRLVESVASGTFAELTQVQRQVSELEARIEQIYLVNPEFRQTRPSGGELTQLESRVEELRRRAGQLSEVYVEEALAIGGSESGGMGGIARVAEMRQQIAQRRIAMSGMEAKLSTIEARLSTQLGALQAIPGQTIQLTQLERERALTAQAYTTLVTRLQDLRITEEGELGYARVVERAGVPTTPIGPGRAQAMLVSLLLGLAVGVAIIVLMRFSDTRVRTPDHLKEQGLGILGIIPDVHEVAAVKPKSGQESASVRFDPVLVMLHDPLSPVAEAWRHARTNLRHAAPDREVKVIVVTSASPGEGKSTVASNLAIAMAASNQRTVLVDCDVRRPRVHRLFGIARRPGLADLIFSEEEADYGRFISGIDNLAIIPSGSEPPNPSELLGSKRLTELIAGLREAFEVVILDTPPILAFTDSTQLAVQSDGVILVASAGETDLRALQQAMNNLRAVDAPLLGAVLNRYHPEDDPGSGQGYYYGKYGYGYYDAYRSEGKGKAAKSKSRRAEKDLA